MPNHRLIQGHKRASKEGRKIIRRRGLTDVDRLRSGHPDDVRGGSRSLDFLFGGRKRLRRRQVALLRKEEVSQ